MADLEERVGPITRLVWWDEIVIQPFEWVDDPASFEATAERLYFYAFETERSRFFVAKKGAGTIVYEAETLIPADYIEYALWCRSFWNDRRMSPPFSAILNGRARTARGRPETAISPRGESEVAASPSGRC